MNNTLPSRATNLKCNCPIMESLERRVLLSVNVLTHDYNNTHTGENLAETVLTPANVNSTTFGELFSTPVDGQVYAQPLYVHHLNMGTLGVHNVVFVATEHDSLYAIDADSGAIIWQRSFIDAANGVTTLSVADVGGSTDITPEIGITSTPVINLATHTLYVFVRTKEIEGSDTHYIDRLHAINMSTGADKPNGSVVVADTIANSYGNYSFVSGPTVNGTGAGSVNGVITFNALIQNQRAALTLANGSIYIAFSSHGDSGPYHGWVLSYSAGTLKLNGVFNDSPNGSQGGIWNSGSGLAVDSAGNLYLTDGNGTFDTTLNAKGFPDEGDYGDSLIKLSVDHSTSATHQNATGWGLKVSDYFTPSDQATLNSDDLDLGSSGLTILPASAGSRVHRNLIVFAGKQGVLYLIDRNNLGKYNATTDASVQELAGGAAGGAYDSMAFYDGELYLAAASGSAPAVAYTISNGAFSNTPISQSSDTYGYPGASPIISANKNKNAVLWTLDMGSGELRAYTPANLTDELYTGSIAEGVVKFTSPTVANGQVFVGTDSSLDAFGLLS